MTVQEWLGEDNQLGVDIWEKKYRYNNESFDEWLDRVSGGNAELRKLIEEKKFLFGGRTLANRNTNKKGSFSNCYSRGYVNDDLEDIMNTSKEIAMTFKAQGGQGLSLSKLRPKGCGINHGQFQSDGIVPFMEIFNRTTESISQGGCIAEDQLVQTSEGYKKIKDIKVGDSVWTKNGFIKVVDFFDKGMQQVYEVVTSKGYKIETTIDHKFAIDGFNVKHLSELKEGDQVNIIAGHCGDEVDFVPYAYIVGAFLANGYINPTKNGGDISISKDHKDIAEFMASCIENLGFDVKVKDDVNVYRILLNKEVCQYIINELKVNKDGADNIEIPDYIMCGNDNIVVSFLAGALDNDGTIRDTSFKYSTVCEKYANQMMKLFSRIGFFPSLNVSIREGRLPLYDITDSFRKGQVSIPSLKIKKKHISFAKNSRYTTPYTMENTGLTKSNALHLGKISKKDNIGLYTYLESNKKPFSPMIYDTIKSITPTRICHVYDIGLETEHLFNCNGFYVSNSRKGALLMTLDIWHKEAEEFIKIKSETGRIEKANLSLEIDDEFMECVKKYYETGEVITKHIKRDYNGNVVEYDVTPINLYKLMMEKAYDWAEPGCIFTNRFRNYNIMEYRDDYMVITGNPCGEQPLPKHGACNLGSINLSEFVKNPFTAYAYFDTNDFIHAVKVSIEALDTVLDENINNHALKEQRDMAFNYRNVGCGIMGMHDMLIKLGLTYGSKESIKFINSLMSLMFKISVIKSSELAKEKGAFPQYNDLVLQSHIIRNHFSNDELHELEIDKYGLRNCSLLSIAPAGSIGTMLNISTGCEPLFALYYNRKTESLNGGEDKYYKVYTGIAKEYIDKYGEELPEYFNTSSDIDWRDRVDMQAALQSHVDTAISSTINLPNSATQEEIEHLYLYAWEKGLKGVTIFRDGCKRTGILSTDNTKKKEETKTTTVSTDKDNTTFSFDNLPRGVVINIDNDVIGKKRKLITGCGSLHCIALFDPTTGDLLETYLSKGSQGGCNLYMIGLSRLISLAARGGIDIYSIVDQLRSTGACPSYAVRSATKHDTSKGSCCPMAVGNALLDMYEELHRELFVDDDDDNEEKQEVKPQIKKATVSPAKEVTIATPKKNPCPSCGEELTFEGGCNICKNCGWSKCD